MTTFDLFPFTDTIPAANNNPSDDQPLMLENNASTEGLLGVDHISFGENNGGTHLQTTFVGFSTPTLPSLTPAASVTYPAPGIADTAHAQYYLQNPIGTFLLSGIRAFGSCTRTGATITTTNMFNLAGIATARVTRTSTGNYLVNLVADAVNSIDYGVLVSCQIRSDIAVGAIAGYTIVSATQFQLNFAALSGDQDPVDVSFFSFVVFQI